MMMSSKGIMPATLLCAGLLVSGCARTSAPTPAPVAAPTGSGALQPPIAWTPAPLPQATFVTPPVRPLGPQYEPAELFTVQPEAPVVAEIPVTRNAVRRIDTAPAVVQRTVRKNTEYVKSADVKPEEVKKVTTLLPREDTLKSAGADLAVAKASRKERVETPKPKRSFFGSFVTREDTLVASVAGPKPQPERRSSGNKKPEQNMAVKKPVPQTFAEWHVAKAPVPAGKPYILRAAPLPSSKPSRAETPVERDFAVGTATLMAAANIPDTPANIPTRTQPIRLNDRSFATPGKPSVLGTDQDTPIDVVAIGAAPYGVGASAGKDVSAEGADVKWPSAVRLIETGEVQGLSILDEESLLLTLCTGRSVMTSPPDLTSVTTVTAPEIICGRRSRLAIQ